MFKKKVCVPKIEINYEAKVNPNMFEVINHFQHWIQKNHLTLEVSNSFAYNMSLYMCYSYPKASFKQLLWISKTSTLYTLIDDIIEKARTVEEANKKVDKVLSLFFQSVEDSNMIEKNNCDHLLTKSAELFRELFDQLSIRQSERWRTMITDSLEANAKEVEFKSQNISEEKCIAIRNKTSGSEFLPFYAEIILDCDMSPYLDNTFFKQNLNAVYHINTIINDIYSYNKELAAEFKSNLVFQIQENRKISGQEAMDIATEQVYFYLDIFEKSSQELIEKFSSNKKMTKYIKYLKYAIKATQVWSVYCPRYSMHNNNLHYDK